MKNKQYIFPAIIVLVTLFIGACENSTPSTMGGSPSRGLFWIQWGEELSQSFQIDVYATSIPTVSGLNLLPLEHNHEVMGMASFREKVVDIDNLFLGFGPSMGAPLHTDISILVENNIRVPLASKTKPYLRPIYATDYSGDLFSFASVEGGISITADKVLFGRVPGVDLSDCFEVSAVFPPVRVEYPSYDVIDTEQSPVGLSLKEFFHEGIALSQARQRDGLYEVKFITKPEETYDDITFTVSLPVKTYKYYAYISKQSDELRASQFTMTGSTTVYFGKTVQENLEMNNH